MEITTEDERRKSLEFIRSQERKKSIEELEVIKTSFVFDCQVNGHNSMNFLRKRSTKEIEKKNLSTSKEVF